jgi:radical SAM superfamily enzyme YgiQ (UPF0313 family)
MKRITFVATKKNLDPTERELYEMDLVLEVTGAKRAFMDLGLLTVAACTPPGVETNIVDEYVTPIDYDMKTDLVCLSAKTSCSTYAYRVAERFRAKGVPVLLGGIHASLRPDEALQHVDCIVTGEAEHLWPQVVEDFVAGKLGQRYDTHDFPPMKDIPIPPWQKAPSSRYLFHQIQTTRGCPFRCRFCSVPDISGNDFRFKPVENVIAEIEALPRGLLGRQPLYVVDDNFISRTRYTKDLLKAMVPLAKAGKIPPWSAETTINVAGDDEMLDLFRDAGCATLILGLESVEEETLALMDKNINFFLTYPDAIQRIHDRGLTVVGNFIVGFDTDTIATFRKVRDFVQQTGILFPFFSILNPMPGTKLFDDMLAAGRLDHQDWHLYDTRHVVMQPAQMTREELMDGYVWLYRECYGEALLDRLERNWQWRQKPQRLRPQKAFVGARLGAKALLGDSERRSLYRQGIRMMLHRHLRADPGQLLITLDAYEFSRFMQRYATPRYAEHAARFENPDMVGGVAQWENRTAQRRSSMTR